MNAQCVLRGKRSGLCAGCLAERLRSGVGATERKRRDRPHLPARSCRGTFLPAWSGATAARIWNRRCVGSCGGLGNARNAVNVATG